MKTYSPFHLKCRPYIYIMFFVPLAEYHHLPAGILSWDTLYVQSDSIYAFLPTFIQGNGVFLLKCLFSSPLLEVGPRADVSSCPPSYRACCVGIDFKSWRVEVMSRSGSCILFHLTTWGGGYSRCLNFMYSYHVSRVIVYFHEFAASSCGRIN